VSPALVVAPAPASRIVREEQFAPALPVIPYDDIEEAVRAANDTEFGLCASVWSNDGALAADVADRLLAGTVFVNTHGISSIDMYAPMGGWKQSGFGVELGPEGMQAFARQRVRVARPGPAEQEATA
jgi:acyl-CoA reductase-like NAD-dependent aldehyde dehydrogenase